jgi:hypothetical protein
MPSAFASISRQYLFLAEELEVMAVIMDQGGDSVHDFLGLNFSDNNLPERLSMLARQMREDSACLASSPLLVSEHAA